MKLDKFSIESLCGIFTGDTDENTFLYRSGPKLIELFNEFGERDIYNAGLIINGKSLSRKNFTKLKLTKFNGTKTLEKLILKLVDERTYWEEDKNVDIIAEQINKIIKYDNYQLKKINDKYYIEGYLLEDDVIEVTPHFKDIQQLIISEIQNAKYTIWIAVAWFTDPVIYKELKQKQKDGINIRLAISNDTTNNSSGLDYSIFETYKINKFGAYQSNIMHNKFCIIDLKTVLHGSYNWTKSANYHNEQITKDSSRTIAEKFSDRFIEIIKTSNIK